MTEAMTDNGVAEPRCDGPSHMRAQARDTGGRMKVRWFVVGAYAYSALHVLSWWTWLSSSQNEAWFPAFSVFFGLAFLPLNILAGGICRAVWGTLNLLEARCVVDLMVDGAVASLLSVTIILAFVLWVRRLRWARV